MGVAESLAAGVVLEAFKAGAGWFRKDSWEQADERTRFFWLLEDAYVKELPSFSRDELARSWGSSDAFTAVYDRLSAGGDPHDEHDALVAAIEPLVGPTATETPHQLAERVARLVPPLIRWSKRDWQRVVYDLQQVRNLLEAQHGETTAQLAETNETVHRIEAVLTRPDLERHIDWSSRRIVTDDERGFVGRDWVFKRVDEFANRHTRGYLRIRAAAGLGKSALAAEIARRFRAPAFFLDAAAGRSRPDQCLNHLSAELIERFKLPHKRLPERAGEDSGFLSQLLGEATNADRERPIWLVIDGLDEAERLRTDANPLLLPRFLPPSVRVLLTHRPGDYELSVEPGVGQEEFKIRKEDTRQTADIKGYLRSRAAFRAAGEAATPPLTVEELVNHLSKASDGNFMYVAFVLADVARDPRSLDLHDLPRGLVGYYQRMWAVIEQDAERDWDTWEQLQRPVIEKLVVVGEPVSAAWLADHIKRPAEEITRRALRPWERFLDPQDTRTHRTWRVIHQSFRDFLAAKLDLQAAYRAIAEYYLVAATTNPGASERWRLHEGYAMRHLASHLRQADDHRRLFELVQNGAWRDAQIVYDPSGSSYLNDIDQAWAAAVEVDAAAVENGRRPPDLLEELKLGLAKAELHSFSARLPDELLVRLLTSGTWAPTQALAAGVRSSARGRRAGALAALAPHLPAGLLDEALDAAAAIANPLERVYALTALAPHLPNDSGRRALTVALNTATTVADPQGRANALIEVGIRLPDDRRAKVLAEALDIVATSGTPAYRAAAVAAYLGERLSDEPDTEVPLQILAKAFAMTTLTGDYHTLFVRSYALATLAPLLPDELLAEALAAASAMGRRFTTAPGTSLTAEALAALAPSLPDPLLAQALEAATGITDPQPRAKALAALAPRLPDPLLAQALEAATGITDPQPRAKALAALAPRLPDPLLAQALEAATGITDPQPRAKAFAALVPHLRGEQRAAAVADALEAARAISVPYDRAAALAALAPHLSDQQRSEALAQALKAAWSETEPEFRVRALVSIAAHLSGEERSETVTQALDTVGAITDPDARARTLVVELAPCLPDQFLAQALDTVGSIASPDSRAFALDYLVRRLPDSLLPKALSITTTTDEDALSSARALAELVPYLGDDRRTEALTQALAAATTTTDAYGRVWLLGALLPHLPEERRAELIPQAIDSAKTIEGDDRDVAIARLAPYLPASVLNRTLDHVATSTDSHFRWHALDALVDAGLPDSARNRALDSAIGIADPNLRAVALLELTAHLTCNQRATAVTQTITAADAITDLGDRAKVLATLAPHLPAEQRAELITTAFATARTIADPDARSFALAQLAPHLPDDERAEALTKRKFFR